MLWNIIILSKRSNFRIINFTKALLTLADTNRTDNLRTNEWKSKNYIKMYINNNDQEYLINISGICRFIELS